MHSRTVTPGYWNGPNWVINEGLNPGERVIVTNVLRMSPNQLVKPVLVKAPAPQAVTLPTPPTEAPISNPYGAGARVESKINQAQDPNQLPMPTPPATAPQLRAPKEVPLAPGVPTAPAPVPETLQAPKSRTAQ